MRKHKYKVTVTEYGEEIDMLIDFDDLDEVYSAIGRYGSELRNNMRQYVMDDKHGNELYEEDTVKLNNGEIGVIKFGISNTTSEDNYCSGEALGYYINLEGDSESLGNSNYNWGEAPTTSCSVEKVTGQPSNKEVKDEQQIKQEAYANLPNEHCTILQDYADLQTDGISTITVAATWQCTNEMRWLDETNYGERTGTQRITLQQRWLSSAGEVDWRDVPTVKDE